MIIKLKEGCLIELNNIKTVKAVNELDVCWNIEISYFDDKKNPKSYIHCESEEEANLLIDKLLNEIKDSTRVKFL